MMLPGSGVTLPGIADHRRGSDARPVIRISVARPMPPKARAAYCPAMGWLWLGLVLGLLVGAGAVALVVRAVGKLTGTDLRSVGRLVVDGLPPGRRREGVAAQRALARRLKRAGERTASGRRVAAEELTVHVSPEDH